jgi:DNA processing protein
VLEAGIRSGSLNTAGHAATLGRPLGAVPGPVTSPASAGCHRLLREYNAVCVVDADQMAELAGVSRVPADVRANGSGLSPDLLRITDALSTRSPREIDDLVRRTGMSVHEVMAVLGVLELSGAAVRHPDGWLRRRSARQARDGETTPAAAP